MATKRHYVYLHRNAITNEVFYIGKGCGTRAWKKSTRSEWWKRIEAKYGRIVEILKDDLDEDAAFILEKETIAHYGRENLCNLNDGGNGGINPSDETRKKMSIARKGVKFSKEHVEKLRIASSGRRHSEETKEKIRNLYLGKPGRKHSEATKKILSEQRKGLIRTAEHCAKISASKKGKPGRKLTEAEKENLRLINLGRVCSDETKEKLSKAHKGKKHSEETMVKIIANNRKTNIKFRKPVKCSNGMIFEYSGHAEEWLIKNGYPLARRTNIVTCCKGKLKTAYGFTWHYI